MSNDTLSTELHLADVLAHQSRLNTDIAGVLDRFVVAFEAADEEIADVRESVGSVAAEVARLNQRVESLVQTVAALMQKVEPLPAELHSVKVPE